MRIVLLLAAAALLAGCGYPGDPLPPALNIPEKVTDLRALQRGDRILIEFTIPPLTTEALPLSKVSEVELRLGPGGEPPFNIDRWAASASRAEVAASTPGLVQLSVPAAPWAGQELFIAVRAAGPSGRKAVWSDVAVLTALPPIPKPSNLTAQSASGGVRLEWQGTGPFRVYRRAPSDPEYTLLAKSGDPSFVDPSALYGRPFEYRVQSAVPAGNGEAESEPSDPVSITPEDRFPPAVPGGLTAVAGASTVELAWERNSEADLAGYIVYRAEGDAPLAKHAGRLPTPAFSDRAVESGKRYRYAVASIDALGNESKPSPPVEIVAP
ncbi:MAG: hypothetical protein SFV54_14885 [Bryobacteraceae bacterium]|nr:hypothetical protein [Bryobacteraceae bacterium]